METKWEEEGWSCSHTTYWSPQSVSLGTRLRFIVAVSHLFSKKGGERGVGRFRYRNFFQRIWLLRRELEVNNSYIGEFLWERTHPLLSINARCTAAILKTTVNSEGVHCTATIWINPVETCDIIWYIYDPPCRSRRLFCHILWLSCHTFIKGRLWTF